MNALKWMWFVAVPLAVGACTTQHFVNTLPNEFDLACEVLEKDYEDVCDGLTEPDVIISMAPAVVKALGFYIPRVGEKFVYVLPQWALDKLQEANPLREVPSQSSVILHETIHYILDWGGVTAERCESEALARKYTAIATGQPEDPNWRIRYGCGADPRQLF